MAEPATAAPRASLSTLDAAAMLVGIVIGIGIFKTPSLVANFVPNETYFIGVWVLGGFVTFVGALCYAELGSSRPSAGGEYQFLKEAYGPKISVLFAWARCSVIQPGAIAAVAFVLGDYASQIAPLGGGSASIYAALAIGFVSGLNLLGTQMGRSLQFGLTVLTVVAVLAVAVAPFVAGVAPALPAESSSGAGSLGLAMILVLLTYGGWNEAAYVSAEMRDVRRQAGPMLMIGALVLTVIYVLVNAALLWAFGLAGLRQSQAPGADLMRLLAGDTGAFVLSAIVIVTALSTLNGTIFTGARIYYAIGKDIPLLRRLGVWNERGDVPRNGILLQGFIALLLVGLGSVTRDGFQTMVDYTAPVFWGFMFLVGLSLFVLRIREPDRALPFRVPLYPLTPAAFCATCLYMLHASIAYTGYGALAGLAVVATGAPLIFSGVSRSRRSNRRTLP